MGDADDVDIYVAQPIYEWQQTDQGKWVMQHAQDLRYNVSPDLSTFGHRVTIYGEIEESIGAKNPQAAVHRLLWRNDGRSDLHAARR